MDEVDNEMIDRKTINNISKKHGVSLEDAYLIYSGKSSGLIPEVKKKIKPDPIDPDNQIILKELRELRAIVDSEDRTRPSDPPLGPQIKTQTEQNPSEKHAKLALLASVPSSVPPKKLSPAKRTKNKDSTALNAYILKHATKPNKDLLVLARAKFPDMDITIPSLKMRKSRLCKKSDG